jgi:hypothetical protein
MCYKSNDIKYHGVSVMSEWVSGCCLAPTQLYHAENKLIFNEINDDEVRFCTGLTRLVWYS